MSSEWSVLCPSIPVLTWCAQRWTSAIPQWKHDNYTSAGKKIKKARTESTMSLIVITVLISFEALFISVVPTAACYNPKWAVPPALSVIWQRDAHSTGEEFTLVSPSVPLKLWLALQRCLSRWLLHKGAWENNTAEMLHTCVRKRFLKQ